MTNAHSNDVKAIEAATTYDEIFNICQRYYDADGCPRTEVAIHVAALNTLASVGVDAGMSDTSDHVGAMLDYVHVVGKIQNFLSEARASMRRGDHIPADFVS